MKKILIAAAFSVVCMGGASAFAQTLANSNTFTAPASYGQKGSNVAALQTLLIQQGYMQGSATGYFGPITQAALNQALAAVALPASSTVTIATMSTLTATLPPLSQVGTGTGVSATGGVSTGGVSGTTSVSATGGVSTGGVSNTSTGTTTSGGGNTNSGVTAAVSPNSTLPSQTVSYGQQNENVKKLQLILIQKGLLKVAATGYYGPLTQTALNQAFVKLGMTATTSVTPAMAAAIAAMN